MSWPPSSDLVWVRVDSYTSEPAAATVEAIAYAQRLVAVPEGKRISVSSIELDSDDGPGGPVWTIYVSLRIFTPYQPPEPKPEQHKEPRWRRFR